MTHCSLVTGAAGFIGSHLSRNLLDDGWPVVGIDNFDPFYGRSLKQKNLETLTHDNFRFIEEDLCNRNATIEAIAQARPTVIYHMAALAGVRPSIDSPHRYVQVNIDGLVNVLDAARESGCRNVIFASSSSVYGNNRKVPFSEDDRVDEPISPYAATKRAGELICHTYGHLFGLSIAMLRFFTVYGPAQRPDLAIARFMRCVLRDEPIEMFGDGTSSRDYTFIDDIIAGVRSAADHVMHRDPGFCRIWNLGGSRPIALHEMIDTIFAVAGRRTEVVRCRPQPGDVERTCADLSRSEVELGYRVRVPIEEGVARQWHWMQSASTGA